jgi:hypothetical protein
VAESPTAHPASRRGLLRPCGARSHIVSVSGGSEGLGFVVSSNLARRVLLEEPTVWTGMSGYLLKGELARVFNLPQGAGIMVQGVATGSPATGLGLRPGSLRARIGAEELLLGGDVILSVMGVPAGQPDSPQRIRAALAARRTRRSPRGRGPSRGVGGATRTLAGRAHPVDFRVDTPEATGYIPLALWIGFEE